MRQDPLKELIQSLSKTEKRYFKLTTNLQKGNKRYIELFDALEKDAPFVAPGSSSQLPVLRNYLQQLILKSLRGFHEEASMDIELRNELNEIELLFSRKQLSLAWRLLEKAKKRAAYHERYPILLQVHEWEMRLNGPESSAHQQEDVDRVHREWEDTLKRYDEVRTLRKLYDDSYFFKMKRGLARDAESERAYEAMVAHPLLQGDAKKLTFQGQVIYHLIYSRYYHAVGKLDLDSESTKIVMKLFDKEPDRIIDLEPYYNRAVLYQLNEAMEKDHYDVAHQMIERLKANKHASDPVQNQTTAMLMEFGVLQQIGMYDAAAKLVPALVEMREQKLAKRSRFSLAIIDDQLARHFFAVRNYEQALEFSNKILFQKGGVLGQNLQSTVRILVLMSHFELGNYKYMKYATKAAYQYLYRHNRLFDVEKRLLSFFAQADAKTKPEEFVDLKSDLDSLSADRHEPVVVDYYDLLTWIEGKAEGKSYAEVIQAKPEAKKWSKYFTKVYAKKR